MRIFLNKNKFKQAVFQATLVTALILLSGCGTIRHLKYPFMHTYDKVSAQNKGFTAEYPKSFTVYPFKNFSWDKTAALRAQREIAMAFSLIGPVSSITETAEMASNPYSYEDAVKVARKQKSDAVVVGEVLKEDSVFLFVWAYNYVKLKLTVYDAKNGEVIWTGSSWSMSNEFGSLLFWIPVPSLTGILAHVFWSRKINGLYHNVALDTIYTIRPDLVKLK